MGGVRMGRYDDKTSQSGGKWIGLVFFLLITAPEFFVPLGIFGGIIWLAAKAVGKAQHNPGKSSRTSGRYTTRRSSFDECPQPIFCFHKDKAEHHVRRGKEIDPWDRPDIDISKYQRNR